MLHTPLGARCHLETELLVHAHTRYVKNGMGVGRCGRGFIH